VAGFVHDPLFVVLLLVATVFTAGAGLPLAAAAAVVSTQTVLALRWLRRYGETGEG
jgi:cytochrome c biogenesis protein CcdA